MQAVNKNVDAITSVTNWTDTFEKSTFSSLLRSMSIDKWQFVNSLSLIIVGL